MDHISNSNTEERAKRYYEFFTKDMEAWNDLIKTSWPQNVQTLKRRMKSNVVKIALNPLATGGDGNGNCSPEEPFARLLLSQRGGGN